MGSRRVTMQLRRVSRRLVALRDELRIIDEQRLQLVDEAEGLELRAMVADSPAASAEAREATKHAAAISGHRDHVVAEIARLERRQDELLDQLTTG